MNTLIQNPDFTIGCCPRVCEAHYYSFGKPVINSYKCDQEQFSSAALWNVQRKKKMVAIKTP